jgi:ribonuclease HII
MKIAGIDEAGKGPVIGPLVVCGFALKKEMLEELKKLGVRDSKRLSKGKRDELFDLLLKLGECEIVVIHPDELDRLMEEKTINEVLFESFGRIIAKLKPELAYIDSPDVKPERLREKLESRDVVIISEHKADEKYPIVAAASIIAKVVRDDEIEKLKKAYGDFGSGYASDERTREFLRGYLERNGCFPPCVRKSWKTLKKIAQRSLDEF